MVFAILNSCHPSSISQTDCIKIACFKRLSYKYNLFLKILCCRVATLRKKIKTWHRRVIKRCNVNHKTVEGNFIVYFNYCGTCMQHGRLHPISNTYYKKEMSSHLDVLSHLIIKPSVVDLEISLLFIFLVTINKALPNPFCCCYITAFVKTYEGDW